MTLQEVGANHDAAEFEECVVDVIATFAADAEAAELMQPADRSFDDPTKDAQATAMFCVSSRQHRLNTPTSQLLAMSMRVVSAIALNPLGTLPWPAALAAHRRNRVDQRQKLGHVVTVGSGYRGCERNAVSVGDQMMFAAGFAAIRWIGSRFFPPCTARTDEESTTARDQSIRSASCRCASSASWIFCHTPLRCQAYKRRQAVMPLPQPSSCGRCSQGSPVLSTNKIADKAWRFAIGLRPGYRLRRFFGGGKSGSMIFHNLSSKIGLAMTAPPCAAMNLAI